MFRLDPLRCGLAALVVAALIATCAVAQVPPGPGMPGPQGPVAGPQYPGPAGQPGMVRPPLRVAERTDAVSPPAAPQLGPGNPNEHPLMPALRWAREGAANIERIQDYSATLVKRQRVNGKLGDYEYMFLKIRHKPFSVYLYFLAPAAVKGQEVIFVDGLNDGKMWAHTVGLRNTLVGKVSLKPDGPVAMRGQLYPLTEIGMLILIRRLAEVAEQDIKYGECDVKYFRGAKINNRVCTCLQVVHPVPRKNFLFHIARIFVDDELNVPVRFESHDWPKEAGGAPELMEEYTYLNLKLNNGFTDADFDTLNPKYAFPR